MGDPMVWIVRIVELYPSMSEEGISIGERQKLSFRIAGSQQKVEEETVYPFYNAWLKANPGIAAQIRVTAWNPHNDKW